MAGSDEKPPVPPVTPGATEVASPLQAPATVSTVIAATASLAARQIEIVDLSDEGDDEDVEDEEELAEDELQSVQPSVVPSAPIPTPNAPSAASSTVGIPVNSQQTPAPVPSAVASTPPAVPPPKPKATEVALGVPPTTAASTATTSALPKIIVDDSVNEANPIDITAQLPLTYPELNANYPDPLLPEEPAPVSATTRLTREIDALQKTKPANAALLLSAWAFELLATEQPTAAKQAVARAKSLAPELRAVALTERLIADHFGEHKEALALLRTEVTLIRENNERAAMLRYLAQLETAPDAHEKALREAVALEPNDCAGWDLLASHFLRKKNYKEAVNSLESLAANIGDSAARSVMYAASAAIREHALDDAAGAVSTARRALEAHPGHLAAWCIVEQLHLRSGAWADYARTLIAQGAQIDDAETARELFDRAGDVFWLCVRDNNSTARCYEHAFALAPTERVSLEKLRSLTEFTGRYDNLPRTFERLLRLVSDPRERAALFLSMGALYDARLHRTDDAIVAYQSALETMPTLSPAADALAALLQRTNRWDSWCTLARTEAERVDSPQARAVRYVAIALVYESKLDQLDEAVGLYDRALSLDPSNPSAFDALERIYRSRGDYHGLLSVLERALDGTHDTHRKWILRQQLAQLLLDQAGDTQRALKLLEVLATEPAHNGLTIANLARVQALSGDWPGYVQTLEKLAGSVTDREEQLRSLERVAVMTQACLNDPTRSLHAWNNVLAKSAQHEQGLHAVAALHEQAGRWEDLLATERKLLNLSRDPIDAALRWHRIGRINEDRLGRPEKALEAYEQALMKAPGLDTARSEVERLLRQLNKPTRLAELCEQQAALKKNPVEKAEQLVRAARIVELALRDLSRAVSLYEQAMAADGNNFSAIWGLVRIHESAKRWPQVEALLRRLMGMKQSNVARMRVAARLARLYELVIPSPSKAAACWEDALGAHAAGSVHILDRLRTARIDGSPELVAQWLGRAAQSVTDSRYCRALLSARAVMIEHEANDPRKTLEAHQAVLSLDDTDRAALEGFLRGLHGATTDPRWPQVIRARALASESPEVRAVGCYAAARVLEKLNKVDEARNVLMQSLESERSMWCSLECARTLAMSAHAYPEAVVLALRAADVAVHPDNRAEALLDAAMLQATELGAMGEALTQVRTVLERSPNNTRALRLAVTLMEGISDWEGIHWALGIHANASSNPDTQLGLLIRRAAIASEFLQDHNGALHDLQKARAIQPSRIDLIERLALEQMVAKHWSDAAQSWREIAQKSEDPAAKSQALLTEARIWSDYVRDDQKALALLEQLFKSYPDDRMIRVALARISARTGGARRAIELLVPLTHAGEWPERVQLAMAVAALERDGLGDDSQANVHLRAVFDVAVMQSSTHAVIQQEFARTERWAQYCAFAEDALKRAPAGATGAMALRMNVAQIQREKLQNGPAADAQLRAAVELNPRAVEPRLVLALNRIATDEMAALVALRDVIDIEPSSGEAFRGMVIAHQRTGSTLTAGMVASAAALLGTTEAPVDAALSLAVSPPPREAALSADEALDLLVGRTQAWHVRRLMAQLEPHLYEIFPAGLESLRTYSRVAEGTPHAQMLRSIAACFAVGPVAMYAGRGREASVVLGTPHAIIVGAEYFADGAIGHFIFQAASLVARIAGQSAMVLSTATEHTLALLECLTDAVADGPGYRELRKRAQSILPRRVRKDIETIGEESAGNLRTEFVRWQEEELRRALRSATLLARDLRIVAQFVAASALTLPSVEARRAALAQNALMVDALRFAGSLACQRGVERVFGVP